MSAMESKFFFIFSIWFSFLNHYLILENLFNLKFAAKELERSAKRCEKDAVTEKAKLKRAIEQGNMEGAKIYAENVIRNKNQA